MFDLSSFFERFFERLGQRTKIYLVFGLAMAIGVWMALFKGWYGFLILPSIVLVFVIITDIWCRLSSQKTNQEQEKNFD